MTTTDEKTTCEQAGKETGNETILVVEDDRLVQELTCAVLGASGYRVITAEDGEEGVSTFMKNQEQIDLVLMDMIMPKMNGMEAYEEMRKLKPDMKIVFVSGYANEFRQDRLASGAVITLLSKPTPPSRLLSAIRTAIGTH